MDKLKVLLIMLLAATSGLAVSMYILALIFAPSKSPLGVLVTILTSGFSPNLTFFIPLSSLLFLSTVLASIVGVIYFLVVPEMKNYVSSNGKDNISVVLKTLKPEERKVVGVLDAHGGTYLQKFITKEAGLSRLKTHRVIAALSERGIVHVEKQRNTNQVTLLKWFHDGMNEFLVGQLHTMTTEDDISNLPKVEQLLVLIAVVLCLKGKKKVYISLKEIREQCAIIEKARGLELVENLEDYVQDLSDRGILDIHSLKEIGINGVPAEKLESFLDGLFQRLSVVLENEDKGRKGEPVPFGH
jgi:hypothetical protein